MAEPEQRAPRVVARADDFPAVRGDDLVHDYLRAIEFGGRIRVLYSNKDYGCEWDYDFRNKRWLAIDNTRFAINIIQYALGA